MGVCGSLEHSKAVFVDHTASSSPIAVSTNCNAAQPHPQASAGATADDVGTYGSDTERNSAGISEIDGVAMTNSMSRSISSWILSTSPSAAEEELSFPQPDRWTRSGWPIPLAHFCHKIITAELFHS